MGPRLSCACFEDNWMRSGADQGPADPKLSWRPLQSPRIGLPDSFAFEGTGTSTSRSTTPTAPRFDDMSEQDPDTAAPPEQRSASPEAAVARQLPTDENLPPADQLAKRAAALRAKANPPKPIRMLYGGHSSGQPLLTPRSNPDSARSVVKEDLSLDLSTQAPPRASPRAPEGAGVGPLLSDTPRGLARSASGTPRGVGALDSARSQSSSSYVVPSPEVLLSARGEGPSSASSSPRRMRSSTTSAFSPTKNTAGPKLNPMQSTNSSLVSGSPAVEGPSTVSLPTEPSAANTEVAHSGSGVWHAKPATTEEYNAEKARMYHEEQVSEKINRFVRMYRKGQMTTKVNANGQRFRRRLIVDVRKRALVMIGARGPRVFPFAKMGDIYIESMWNHKTGVLETVMMIHLVKHRSIEDPGQPPAPAENRPRKSIGKCFGKLKHEKVLRLVFTDAPHAQFFAACVELLSVSSAALLEQGE